MIDRIKTHNDTAHIPQILSVFFQLMGVFALVCEGIDDLSPMYFSTIFSASARIFGWDAVESSFRKNMA